MNNNAMFAQKIGFLVLGVIVGWFFWGHEKTEMSMQKNSHTMPDGSIMADSGMDMSQMMADMNKALEGKSGDEFDKAFLNEMIVHHQGAIDMAQLAEASARHQEIKDLSKAIIEAQTDEISQMKMWQKEWFN